MAYDANRAERFASPGMYSAGDFAPLFNQMSYPLDRGLIRDGMATLSRRLGTIRPAYSRF
ncbi:hypothetical protein ACFOMD_16550 [Sphingoaurantiacus capsulatus]|uniref:Uncharacterized protein n=1 Tax=Sphingoaurantiacus capsulatus TaxID=1771310 RepID=A0ABV7XEM1_9SPHN